MPRTDERQVDFYFDYISHNAYLAWQVLPALAEKYGYSVRAIPVLFAGFLKAFGQLGPAEIEPKLHWMNRNNLRKATILGIPLNAPQRHPFNPLFLLRLSAQKMPEAERSRLTSCLLRAVWVDAIDPDDTDAIGAYLRAGGINPESLTAGARTGLTKARLKANTDEAIARGGFGVPTMLVGDQVFWGYDDLPYLEALLNGSDPLDKVDLDQHLAAWEDARSAGQHRDR